MSWKVNKIYFYGCKTQQHYYTLVLRELVKEMKLLHQRQ